MEFPSKTIRTMSGGEIDLPTHFWNLTADGFDRLIWKAKASKQEAERLLAINPNKKLREQVEDANKALGLLNHYRQYLHPNSTLH